VSPVLLNSNQERGLEDVRAQLAAEERAGTGVDVAPPDAAAPGRTAGPTTPITTGRGPEVGP